MKNSCRYTDRMIQFVGGQHIAQKWDHGCALARATSIKYALPLYPSICQAQRHNRPKMRRLAPSGSKDSAAQQDQQSNEVPLPNSESHARLRVINGQLPKCNWLS